MFSPTLFLTPQLQLLSSLLDCPNNKYPHKQQHIHKQITPKFNTHSPRFQCHSIISHPLSSHYQNDDCMDPTFLAYQLQSSSTLKHVQIIHAIITRTTSFAFGNVSPTFLFNNMISAYIRFGELITARKLFDNMSKRNVVSWTALLNGYIRFGLDNQAFSFLAAFFKTGIRPNAKTYVCIYNLCSSRLDFELGKQIHACVVKHCCSNLIVDSAVVYFYAQCGDLGDMFRAFQRMKHRDVVSWTTVISACSQQHLGEEAFTMFLQMLYQGFTPNEFTMCSVLKACGDEEELGFGRQLHGAVVKKICKNDVFIATSLVDMYAKCGEIVNSRTVFNGMTKRNTVSWTSMIAGYARNGLGEEAIHLFRVMRRRKISANKLTMVGILKACGLVKDLLTGKEMHAQIVKNCIHGNIYLRSTLVWLYCKCGEYATAYHVLEGLPLKDVVSWTAMISGCARLGHEHEALRFLKEMLGEGVEPNTFTYSSALKACAKLKNIWQGKLIHSSVNKTPALSNVFVGSSLINMYAKCGCVSEATQIFDSMPERNLVSWKAMILCYAKNGFCGEALKFMYRMQAEGIEVDDYVLSTVLTTCGDFGWSKEPSLEHSLHVS